MRATPTASTPIGTPHCTCTVGRAAALGRIALALALALGLPLSLALPVPLALALTLAVAVASPPSLPLSLFTPCCYIRLGEGQHMHGGVLHMHGG